MRILVLMPLRQEASDMAAALYNALPEEIKDVTFPMPTYMEYLVLTKQSPNYLFSCFDTLYSAEKIYETSVRENLDLMIFGNINSKYKFDKVFNFQDIDNALLYEDKFIERVAEDVKSEDKLLSMVNNLHKKEESSLALTNCSAAAEFLAAYMKTDPHLEEIEKEYKKKVGDINA